MKSEELRESHSDSISIGQKFISGRESHSDSTSIGHESFHDDGGSTSIGHESFYDNSDSKPVKRRGRFIFDIMGGGVILKKNVRGQTKFIMLLVVLAMLYITNTYIAEDFNGEIRRLSSELESLRIEYAYNESEIIRLTKQSELVKVLKNKGLKETVEPLKKITIYVNQEKQEQ